MEKLRVTSTFTLSGPPEELDRFMALFEPFGGRFTFEALIPSQDTSENWRVENWGSPVDADEVWLTRDREFYPNEAELTFDTLCQFPRPVLEEIVKRFPGLTLLGSASCDEWCFILSSENGTLYCDPDYRHNYNGEE